MVLYEYGTANYEFVKPDNLIEMFENTVKKHAKKPFIGEKDQDGVYRWITYGEIKLRIDKMRGGLAKIGVQKGDTVGIIANNCKEWFIIESAAHGLGAIFVPMYLKELVSMWKYIIQDAAIKVLFVSSEEVYEKIKIFKEQIPTLKKIIVIKRTGANSFEELEKLGEQNPVDLYFPKPTEKANIMYTSGTTGEPKGVILTHGNQTANINSGIMWYYPHINGEGTTLVMLPWAHTFGLTVELHAFMSQGGALGLVGSIDTMLEDFVKVKPTFFVTVPKVFNTVYNRLWAMMKKEGGTKLKLFKEAVRLAKIKRETGKSSIKLAILNKLVFGKIKARFGGRLRAAMTGSAPMNLDISHFFLDVGIPVLDCYGLTETSPGISMTPPMEPRFGAVGKPMIGTKVIIDRTQVGEDSKDGEIVVFGPQVMLGYHNKPEKTKEVFVEIDGMRGFRTGDKGWLDDDGYLYITGRFKEEYKLENGKYVHPESIENEMKLIPYVLNALVYGDGRPYNVALIVLDRKTIEEFIKTIKLSVDYDELFDVKNPASEKVKHLLEMDIQNHLRKRFGGYEIPRRFIFTHVDFTLENGFLTQTMKVKRAKLMEVYGSQLYELYD